MSAPMQVLVADWSQAPRKRVTYRIEVDTRLITHVEAPVDGWTVAGLVGQASRVPGPVLILIDAAIGLPISLFEGMREATGSTDTHHLLQLLREVELSGGLGVADRSEDWSVRTPYFRVPAGRGALTKFKEAARGHGVGLLRTIDLETGGKSPLILSGIPGTVGSASRAVLRELARLNPANEDVKVWPFDGALSHLLSRRRIVIGEIYPRALYGHALLPDRTSERSFLSLPKTKAYARKAALEDLRGLDWHVEHEIQLSGQLIERAESNEDHFDAFVSALGVLRLLMEHVSIEDASLQEPGASGRPILDGVAEGGMLGVLRSQLKRKPRAFRSPACVSRGSAPTVPKPPQPRSSGPDASNSSWVRVTRRAHDYAMNQSASRQISFSGFPVASKRAPLLVELECRAVRYTLAVEDTTACWRRHQISTARDFDALYELLSQSPGDACSVKVLSCGLPHRFRST